MFLVFRGLSSLLLMESLWQYHKLSFYSIFPSIRIMTFLQKAPAKWQGLFVKQRDAKEK